VQLNLKIATEKNVWGAGYAYWDEATKAVASGLETFGACNKEVIWITVRRSWVDNFIVKVLRTTRSNRLAHNYILTRNDSSINSTPYKDNKNRKHTNKPRNKMKVIGQGAILNDVINNNK